MSRHNGVVTSLKFSPDGRWLALGSDDKICLIWEKDNTQIAKLFGTDEHDLEHWTVRKDWLRMTMIYKTFVGRQTATCLLLLDWIDQLLFGMP